MPDFDIIEPRQLLNVGLSEYFEVVLFAYTILMNMINRNLFEGSASTHTHTNSGDYFHKVLNIMDEQNSSLLTDKGTASVSRSLL